MIKNYKFLKKSFLAAFIIFCIPGCSTIDVNVAVQRTSPTEMTVSAEGRRRCGPQNVYEAAVHVAAKETLKAGFQEFGIFSSKGIDNTWRKWIPERIEKFTKIKKKKGVTTIETSIEKIPGYYKWYGTYIHHLGIRFLTEKQPYASKRINAYTFLGPQWLEAINTKDNAMTCS